MDPMNVEAEPSASVAEDIQAPLEPVTGLPLSVKDVSSFKGLVDRHLEPVGAPSLFFV